MCHDRSNRNLTTYRTDVVPGVVSTWVHDTRGMAVKLAHRRRFLHLAAGAAALPAVSRVAWAQAYPARSVRVVVPVAAGGANDVTARLVGQWLSERLGQQFFIENRPGAGTNVGTEAVIRASADGYTLLISGSNAAINPTLFQTLNFNFIRDTAPIASIVRVPQLMQVNPSLPVKNVPEFIAYAKANPGKIAMGSGGNGSPAHVIGEYFKLMTGTDLTHVPYRGAAPAVSDLLGGQIQVAFTELATSLGHVKSGNLRALAVTTAARTEALPDIPTLSEFIPGFEASQWVGLVAPKDTPSAIIEKLNTEINAGLADPKLKARFAELGGMVLPGSPDDFGKLIRDETEKWAKVIRAANIKVE